MSTVYDIAKAAGVSYSTATRVLNGQVNYTRPTYAKRAERIRRIADRMGYRPNAAARATSSGRFDAVGVVIHRRDKLSHGPHPSYVRGICKQLDEQGKTLIYAPISPDELDTPNASRILSENVVDGLVISDNDALGDDADHRINQLHIPTVWINQRRPMNTAHPDDLQGAKLTTQHLIDHGHRRILFVGNPDSGHYSSVDRVEGYNQTLEAAGLTPRQAVWHVEPRERLRQIIADLSAPERPTAVLAIDHDSEAVIVAAAHLGLSIPEDLSLLSLGHGQPMNSLLVDAYEIPAYWVGYHAAQMLIDRINDPEHADLPSIAVPYRKHIPGETVAAVES